MAAAAPRRSSIMASAPQAHKMHRHSGEQQICDFTRPEALCQAPRNQSSSQQPRNSRRHSDEARSQLDSGNRSSNSGSLRKPSLPGGEARLSHTGDSNFIDNVEERPGSTHQRRNSSGSCMGKLHGGDDGSGREHGLCPKAETPTLLIDDPNKAVTLLEQRFVGHHTAAGGGLEDAQPRRSSSSGYPVGSDKEQHSSTTLPYGSSGVPRFSCVDDGEQKPRRPSNRQSLLQVPSRQEENDDDSLKQLRARVRPSRASDTHADDVSTATYVVGPVQPQRQQQQQQEGNSRNSITSDPALQSQTSCTTISDTPSEGKKSLRCAVAQNGDSTPYEVVSETTEVRYDAVSETTEVFTHGKWRKVPAHNPSQPHDREEPIKEEEEEDSNVSLEVQRTSSINRRSTPYPEHLRSSSTRVKAIKLDINIPEQVAALVWRFGPEGGAFLSSIREGAIMPDKHDLAVDDELTSINGNFVRGLPRDEIEHVWMTIQDDESIDFLHLTLLRAPEK